MARLIAAASSATRLNITGTASRSTSTGSGLTIRPCAWSPSGDFCVDTTGGVAQRAAFPSGSHRQDLAHDRQRGLGGSSGTDVEAARPRDPLERVLRHARVDQPLAPARLVAARTERADVERVRLESALQRGEIELVVVSEDDDGGVAPRLHLRQRLLGPRDDDLVGARHTLRSGELRARVGDDRAPAELLREATELLRRVHGAEDEQARRRAE